MDDIWIISWFNHTAFDANPIWKSPIKSDQLSTIAQIMFALLFIVAFTYIHLLATGTRKIEIIALTTSKSRGNCVHDSQQKCAEKSVR